METFPLKDDAIDKFEAGQMYISSNGSASRYITINKVREIGM